MFDWISITKYVWVCAYMHLNMITIDGTSIKSMHCIATSSCCFCVIALFKLSKFLLLLAIVTECTHHVWMQLYYYLFWRSKSTNKFYLSLKSNLRPYPFITKLIYYLLIAPLLIIIHAFFFSIFFCGEVLCKCVSITLAIYILVNSEVFGLN